MRILLDVDGVLADFPSAALRYINGHSPRSNVILKDITEHDILKALGLEDLQERFDRWCAETEVCRHLDVYEGARTFVERLRALGEVVIVTSPYAAVPAWMGHRLAWLSEHFGVDRHDIVFCKRKELVRGHLLIDDKLSNCEAFEQGSAFRQAIVFDRPWNRGGKLTRAKGYDEVIALVREMVVAA